MIEVRDPNLDCEGCASKLKKALFKLKGAFLNKQLCVFFMLCTVLLILLEPQNEINVTSFMVPYLFLNFFFLLYINQLS